MPKKIIGILVTILGAIAGYLLVYTCDNMGMLNGFNMIMRTGIYIVGIILFIILFYLIAPIFIRIVSDLATKAEQSLKKIPIMDIIYGTIGLIIGWILAFLISQPIYRIQLPFIANFLSVIISIILYIGLGYLGIRIATGGREEISTSFSKIKINAKEKSSKKSGNKAKVLDTSSIIDGRIRDVIQTGFIEGPIYVPVFVLEELQHIADSENGLRRQKGRRGLDIIKSIQTTNADHIVITNERFPEIEEVDSKLVKMAKDLNAKVITNDFNLNKVAAVQGVEVLNINELANAMKPIVVPGEEIRVFVIRDGKESNQGLGYLDDGTMIVIENGKRYIGREIDTVVTSVIQTAAGKMIFVKLK